MLISSPSCVARRKYVKERQKSEISWEVMRVTGCLSLCSRFSREAQESHFIYKSIPLDRDENHQLCETDFSASCLKMP
jgi:hypothetical protein